MPQFRKKPIIIEATQFTLDMSRDMAPLPSGVERRVDDRWSSIPLIEFGIQTPEGFMTVSVNDWVITGIKGEKYPCKPDIFAATYEPV